MLSLIGFRLRPDLDDEEVQLTDEQQEAADQFNSKACLYGGLGVAMMIVIIAGLRTLIGV